MSTLPTVTSREQVKIPAIIYGTAWKKARTAELVTSAVQAGFRGIDTACQPKHYHEAGVGQALTEITQHGISRDSLYLQTKFTPVSGQDPNNIPYDPTLPVNQQVIHSFAVSLRNLGTDYLDGLLLHSPIQPFSELLQAWTSMEKLYRDDGVKQLGISNCYDLTLLKKLFDAVTIKPAIVQNRFYPDTNYDTELRAWCKEQGIIYQSFWTLTANRHALGALALGRIAEKYHCEPTQVLLRYVSQSGIVPLTGTTSRQHMLDDLNMFNFTLGDDEMTAVERCLYSGV